MNNIKPILTKFKYNYLVFVERNLFYLLLVFLLLSISTAAALVYRAPASTSQSTTQNNNSHPTVSPSPTNPTASQSAATPTPTGSTSTNKTTSNSSSTSNPSSAASSNSSSSSSSTPSNPASESPSAQVAFYADSQSDTDAEDVNHQRVVNYILSKSANPVFHAGDLMEDGTQNSLDRFNAVTATLRATRTFYSALGNNDRVVGDSTTPSPLYLANFSYPNNERWYSLNTGNLHMVVLDSAFASGDASQLSWLQSDLQSAASQSRITGIMFHHPTFSSTISSYLINNGVDFVIAGHNHAYQHTASNGIHYFNLTGQTSIGHLIAKIYSNSAAIYVYDTNNGLIDTISFNER